MREEAEIGHCWKETGRAEAQGRINTAAGVIKDCLP